MSEQTTAVAESPQTLRKPATPTIAPQATAGDAVLEALAAELDKHRRELSTLRLAANTSQGAAALQRCQQAIADTERAMADRKDLLKQRLDREAQDKLNELARTAAEKERIKHREALRVELAELKAKLRAPGVFEVEANALREARKVFESAVAAFNEKKKDIVEMEDRALDIMHALNDNDSRFVRMFPAQSRDASTKHQRTVNVCKTRGYDIIEIENFGVAENYILCITKGAP